MSDQVQFRGGTTAQHSTFTGAAREMTIDTTKNVVVVHDGATVGGHPMARTDGANTFVGNQAITGTLGASGQISTSGTGVATLLATSSGSDAVVRLTNTTASTGHDWYVTSASNGTLQFVDNTSGGSRATLDTNGNLGLGVTPSAWYTGTHGIEINKSGNGVFSLSTTQAGIVSNAFYSAAGTWTYSSNAAVSLYLQSGGTHTWYNAGAGTGTIPLVGAMTLNASGQLSVNNSANTASTCTLTSTAANDHDTAGLTIIKFENSSATTQAYVRFLYNNVSASGQINANGAGAAAFGTWSDITLKQNITPLASQLDNFLKIETIEFDYIESEGVGHQIGFSAQNMKELFPQFVGSRDDGKLTLTAWSNKDAIMVKAIQELASKNAALEARLATLEGKLP